MPKLFIKRFLLIIIGIILSLVILECGLRLAGWTISSFQQYKNNKALRNKSQYTIMCLGESTTQGQYPVQLQEILDMKYPNKFSVIDCGLGSSRIETILNYLDNNINKYKPDIAICMLGINNGLISENVQKDINIQHIKKKYPFKVLNLILLLKLHIQTMIEKNAYANTNNNDQIKQMEFAIYLYNTKQFEKSINLINKILEKEPFNKLAYTHQIMNYFGDDNIENDILAYKMVLDALDGIDDSLDDYYTYFINGFNYLISNNKPIDELKQRLLKKEQFVVDEIIYNMIKSFLTDSEKQILLNRRNLVNEKTEKDFAYRNSLLLKYPNVETYNLYKSIVKKLIDNNIKVICMQYPIISLQPLKNELKDTNYYYNITFISNEFNFKSKLKSINYWDLFRDQFAGDFGHCTNLGNTLIAENIVNTLENILDLN